MGIEEQAKQLLEAEISAKVEALRAYERAQTERERIAQLATQAQGEEQRTWREVQRHWTGPQLAQLQISKPAPAGKPTNRKRRPKRVAEAVSPSEGESRS